MKSSFRLFFLSMIVLVSSCSEDVNSDEVETERVWAGIVVEAKSAAGIKVNVELNRRTFDGDNLVLVGSDQLTASVQGITKTMDPNDEFLDFDYEARFTGNFSDEIVRVALSRPSTNTSAPNSSVQIPRAFNILQPLVGNSYTNEDIVVTNWSNARNNADVGINYSLSCASNDGGVLNSAELRTPPDNGYYEFSLSSHSVFDNPALDRSKSCSLTVTLRRTNSGNLDPVYLSGRISATQIRSVENFSVQIVN